ncbi:MAG TPA: acyltransferase [Bryobacteraceae bacterium]|nr:acyltransferase [Bryobacteraceae bacterium]
MNRPWWRHLRRITSGGRFVPEIDGLRFVAIAAVVAFHFHGFTTPAGHDALSIAVQHGYRGVNLFYVISGFILGLPFAEQHLKSGPAVRLKRYFLRRLTRLEPPYVLNLAICFALLVLAGGQSARVLGPHLAASMVYLHSLWFGRQSDINPVAWTLEVEVQFYCLAPLLAQVFRIRAKPIRRTVLAGGILIAGALQMLWWNAPDRMRLSILYAIQFFLAGLLLADIYAADWSERPATSRYWDLAPLVSLPLIFLPADLTVWAALPFLILAAYIGTFRGVVFNRLLRNEVIVTAGGMCYTIYLFHYQLIAYARHIAVYLPLLLAISGVYFALIERPCMVKDWPRRAARFLMAPSTSISARRSPD